MLQQFETLKRQIFGQLSKAKYSVGPTVLFFLNVGPTVLEQEISANTPGKA
jgi:hypothetical protein